jgi:hypothetical protein
MQIKYFKLEKMKMLLLFALLLISSEFSFGQEIASASSINYKLESPEFLPHKRMKLPKRKSLYLELGGSGGFGSFNFEWNFMTRNKFRWMLRTGISGTYIDKNNGAGFIFPVMIHGVYGQKHGLDVGIGQALTITTRGGAFLRTPLSIGYRLEPTKSRVFYRFSYTPIVSYLVDFQWEHWGGTSIGFKFR